MSSGIPGSCWRALWLEFPGLSDFCVNGLQGSGGRLASVHRPVVAGFADSTEAERRRV